MLDNYKDLHGDTPEDELSAEQLFERLQGAKLVVKQLQHNMEQNSLDYDRELALNQGLQAKLKRHTERLRNAARSLSRCGQYPHKEKNEVILDTVHSLLCWADFLSETDVFPDNDDIPF